MAEKGNGSGSGTDEEVWDPGEEGGGGPAPDADPCGICGEPRGDANPCPHCGME